MSFLLQHKNLPYMPTNLPLIDVSFEPIELCKLLKIANMVGGGGEAKIVISEGYVLLNNEVEFQKRKKIYHDDIVEFNGEVIQVNVVHSDNTSNDNSSNDRNELNLTTKHVNKAVDSKTTVTKTKKSANKSKAKGRTLQEKAKTEDTSRSKRKPISF